MLMRSRPAGTWLLFCFAATLCAALSHARADQVELTNGDTLRGIVVDRNADGLVLDHPVLGHIVIPAENVRSVLITPRQGEETPPPPVTRTTSSTVVQRPETTPPAPDATSPPETTQEGVAVETVTVTPAPPAPPVSGPVASPLILPSEDDGHDGGHDMLDPLLMEAGFFAGPLPWPLEYLRLKGYRSQIELGFNGTQGVSETTAARMAFLTGRETTKTRSKFGAIYNLSISNNETTRNDLNIQNQENWLMPGSPWYWYLEGIYDYNEFADWEHRIAGSTGPGYQLIKTRTFDLRLRGGLGASKEFGSENDNVVPEGLLGAEVIWKLSSRQRITANTAFYPDLTDPVLHNRSVSTAEWNYLLDRERRLSLKMGVRAEYQSITTDDSPNTDLRYFGALVFGF